MIFSHWGAVIFRLNSDLLRVVVCRMFGWMQSYNTQIWRNSRSQLEFVGFWRHPLAKVHTQNLFWDFGWFSIVRFFMSSDQHWNRNLKRNNCQTSKPTFSGCESASLPTDFSYSHVSFQNFSFSLVISTNSGISCFKYFRLGAESLYL